MNASGISFQVGQAMSSERSGSPPNLEVPRASSLSPIAVLIMRMEGCASCSSRSATRAKPSFRNSVPRSSIDLLLQFHEDFTLLSCFQSIKGFTQVGKQLLDPFHSTLVPFH